MTPLREVLARAGLDWIVPDWDAAAHVRAFFTTRNGPGGSPFDAGPADPGALGGKARDDVLASRALVESIVPSPPNYLEQVHGADVVRIDAPRTLSPRWPVADAAVTRATGVVLAIRVADCLPVLFTDASGDVVAAAHAGWRGLAAGVLEATVDAMAVAPSTIRAWIGPGIGPSAFEVGADVLDAFVSRDPSARAHFAPHPGGKWRADLTALARDRLRAAGVGHIGGSNACTFGEPQRFHSFRRDRSAGRMAAYVWREADAG
jgi:hypothetical protein